MSISLLQGNEACVEGAIAAGVQFFAGYPITPSSEVAEGLAQRLPQSGGKFIQMEDEIAGMAATIGGSLAGLKSMTATSGPGFSLKQENLGFAAMIEVPCVIVNVQRTGPSTGLPTSPGQGDVMQARWGTHGDHPVIALAPSSVKECFDLTVRSFNYAEKYRTPVILLLDEIVGHMREGMEIPAPEELELVERKRPQGSKEDFVPFPFTEDDIPPMANYGEGYRYHATGLFHDETGFPRGRTDDADRLIRRLMNKVERNKEEIMDVQQLFTDDAELIIWAYGSTARSAENAVRQAREKGLKVGLVRPLTIWPFDEDTVSELAARAQGFIVPEMNMGQMVIEVERAVGGQAQVHSLNKANGELFTPQEILTKIEEVL